MGENSSPKQITGPSGKGSVFIFCEFSPFGEIVFQKKK
jgi:hypothetical protein